MVAVPAFAGRMLASTLATDPQVFVGRRWQAMAEQFAAARPDQFPG